MLNRLLLTCAFAASCQCAFSQNPPWERPLMHAWSSDGITFSTPTIFQDSSGVPSVIRWKQDTLICAFQWFRQPMGSPSWDRVAVKFSYDDGASWTTPTPIVIGDLPNGYQRPFDPTLVKLGGDSLRIYFSSSETPPMGGLDATVNTYSAVGTDGVNWSFEPGARVDHATLPIIDPAVIRFGPGWHYTAPKGTPQDGAHHQLSPNGINFNAVPDIPSDPQHNWTGNFMVESPTELRFYGGGANGIWYNHSPNGGQWNGYLNTNLQGGDPSALKVSTGNYLIVYVGQPFILGVADAQSDEGLSIYPVPAADRVRIDWPGHVVTSCIVYAMVGTLVREAVVVDGGIDLKGLPSGAYLLGVRDRDGRSAQARVVKE